ncbi:DUF3500 domain-containing protein [Aquiflexum gelatinilyticum]|uniref:DUF3500 domain-containing protein n=1 Tax=Aquiflexum gelatinilyticum TaxID=2961943 RepID=A0A9X2P8M2_9BACT|nr:DUF3500 domain-containing protein [Aquiflexum gelatinilyticum]MCR9015432.1 DUF3500 domain-containing protein [Aquiflexum gelatinilyticum]
MKKTIFLLVFILTFSIGLFAQSKTDMVKVTVDFMETLSANQKDSVLFSMDDSLRTNWTNLPIGLAPRKGLRYGDLSEVSKEKFHKILSTIFSSQGYLKTFAIMQVDDILHEIFEIAHQRKEIDDRTIGFIRKLDWDYGNYYLAILGNPGMDTAWGFKFEGHHISINLTVTKDSFSMTPLFFGSDPAVVQVTQYSGLRPLSKEEDYGFWFVNTLDENQKAKATLSQEVPKDILTNPDRPQWYEEFMGIKGSELRPEQQKVLHYLIEEYMNNMEKEKAEEYLAILHARGMDEVYFAWIGSYEPMKAHYYMIHSPDFIIEYDNVGFLDNANHIHSIFREKGNDFGEDILRKHLMEHKH